jgi:capsular exopolysaccharide synthesis family protein
MRITVRSRSAARAAEAANAIAAEAVRYAAADPLLTSTFVAEAVPAGSPAAPPRRILEAAGVLVALMLGAMVAMLLERGRPRIRTARDILDLTAAPVIGQVPRSRSLRVRPAGALADPSVGGAIRSLRTFVVQESPTSGNVIGVTSAVPGEGKSTTAAALAASMARIDLRVMLIDADLRRPVVGSHFNVRPSPGVAELLRGVVALPEAITESPSPFLDLLPTRADRDAGDLIARRFADLIKQVKDQYDFVIVDCPPLLVGDDARTLATFVDATLLVVSKGTTTRSVDEAATILNSLGARLLGCVLNRVRHSVRSYGTYDE